MRTEAREAFREELELCRELAVRPIAGEGLAGLAALAAEAGDHERAALLSGAALTHRYEQPVSPADERLRARFLEPARRRWGAEAWDEAVARGAAMGFEEAIALALEDGDA